MSENSGSGTDIVNLGLSVDATQPDKAADALDRMAAATVKATDKLDKMSDAVAENQRWVSESQKKWAALVESVNAESRALEAAEKAQRDFARAQQMMTTQAQDLIVKLNEQVKTFGMGREELLRYKAAQLGVSESAEPLIQKLERLRQQSEQSIIQQKRDIDSREASVKAMREESAAAERAAKEQRELSVAKQKQFQQESASRARHIAEYTKWWQDQIDIQEAAQADQRKAQTVFEAFKRRTMMENRREAMRILEQQERDAATSAEKAAIAEINWARMSVKARIAELERLKAYQANGNISSATISGSFSSAAVNNLPQLDGLKKQYADATREAEKFGKANHGAAHAVSILRSGVTTLLALFGGHEIISMIDSYTKFTAQLKLAADTQAEYAQAYSDVVRISKTAQSELGASGTLYARIQRSTEELGISQKRVADITESVALALRVGGATTMESASAMLQLSQAFAAGRLNGQEFNSVAEAAPRLMKALADGMGVPVGALKEMSKEGMITSEVMAIAIPKALEELRKEADKVRTISGAWTTFRNGLMEYMGAGAEANGITKALTDTLILMGQNVDTVVMGLTTLTALGLAKWLGVAATSAAGLTAGLGAAAIAVKGFFASLGPLGWLIILIGSGVTAWAAWKDATKDANEQAKKSVTETTPEIIEALEKQLVKLRERHALLAGGVGVLAKESPGADEARRLKKDMDAAMAGTGQYAGMGEEQRLQIAHSLGKAYGKIYATLTDISEVQTKIDNIGKASKAEEWMTKLATKTEQMTAELKKAQKELGLDNPALPEIEKRIREKFAEKPKKVSKAAENKELNAYASLTANINSKIEENRLEVKSEKDATEAQKLRIKIDEQLLSGKLKLTPAHKAHIQTLLQELDVSEMLKRKKEEDLELAKEEAKWLIEQAKERSKKSQSVVNAAEEEAKSQEALADALGLTKEETIQLQINRLEDRLEQEKSIAACTAETAELEALIDAKKRNRDATGRIEKFEAGTKSAKEVEDFLDPDKAKDFGEALKDAFGDAGDALSELINEMGDFVKAQHKIDKMREEAREALASGAKDEEWYIEQNSKLNEMSMKQQIAGYGSMANAAKGMFNEQSAGYKTMDGIAKMAHAFQVAMHLKELGLLAVKAVMNQANGDPYSAFARMAVMAAAVAALGYAVGGGFQSNGASGFTAEEMQKNQGAGTVLGDAEAKSESIIKAMEHLEDNSDLTMPISREMLKSLRNIEASFKGVGAMLFRAGGITSGATLGYEGSYNKKLGGLWGENTKELVDSGLTIGGGSTWGGLARGYGFGQYGTVKETDSSWFGLSKDVDYNHIYGNIDPAVAKQLGMIFGNMTNLMTTAGKSFGFREDDVANYVNNYEYDKGGFISLRGLKGEELTDALNNYFSSIGDTMAEWTFTNADIDEFQRVGEGYLEMVVRVANGIEKAQVSLENLGIAAIGYRDIVNKQGDVDAEIIKQSILLYEGMSGVGRVMQLVDSAADDLVETYTALLEIQKLMTGTGLGEISQAMIQGAGGLDKLSEGLSAFQDKFFTDEEKLAMMQRSLQDDFQKIGMSVPATREEFKRIAEQLGGSNTESAEKLLGRLLNLAEAFDKAASMQEDLTDTIEEGSQRAKEAWQGTADSIVDEIKRIRGLINGPDSATSYAGAMAQFATLTGQARSGDQTAAGKLTDASQLVLQMAEQQAGSLLELNRIRAATAGSLEDTLDWIERKYGIKVEGFASGGDHTGGYRIVGEGGPELEATGPSRIFNANQTRAILGGESTQELRAIRQELCQLRAENNAQQVAIARNTEKMEKVFSRNDTGNGLLITDQLPQ